MDEGEERERDLSESDNQTAASDEMKEEFDEKKNIDNHEVPEVSVSETSEQNDLCKKKLN